MCRKERNTTKGYFLAGRSMTWFPVSIQIKVVFHIVLILFCFDPLFYLLIRLTDHYFYSWFLFSHNRLVLRCLPVTLGANISLVLQAAGRLVESLS